MEDHRVVLAALGTGHPGAGPKIRQHPAGKVTDTLIYKSSEYDYFIREMVEYEGMIYLSGHQIPAYEYNSYWELNRIHQDIQNLEGFPKPTPSELMALIRDHYDAIWKPGLGSGIDFTTYYSIATSSFAVGGVSRIYEYRFDETGTLLSCVDNGNNTYFRR